MAGLINWKKVAIPGGNPDSDHVFVGVDISDGMFYFKDSAGNVNKFPTLAQVESTIDDAIATLPPPATKFFPMYSYVGSLNSSNYLYSWTHVLENGAVASGNASNGWRFNDSSPIVCPFNGTVKKAIFRNRGIAQSTGSPAANMTLRYELWNVGVTGGQGTKIGDVNVTFSTAGKTIGNFGNGSVDTNLNESATLNLSVSAGDLLGLKFISQTGNSNVNVFNNAIVSLEIEAS